MTFRGGPYFYDAKNQPGSIKSEAGFCFGISYYAQFLVRKFCLQI